jgi:cobalt-zinc-cadmium efflux system protein
MNNSDNHSHEVPSLRNVDKAFYIGIGLNSIFTLIEFIVGYRTNSLALIADASHNLSDVASLIISLIGMKLAQKLATKLYTYGYKKASIMASLINAILLIVIVVGIAKEAIERFDTVPEVVGKVIIFTALIGVFINTLSAFLFYKGQKDDINIKGAFLHLLVDALVSVGVVISGIVIYYTNWNVIDPIISLIIAVVILISTWGLFKESIKLAVDGVPQNIDFDKINILLNNHKQIQEVHHLHIWALSSTENALTVHIIPKENVKLEDTLAIKKDIKEELIHQNIQHITIEFEKKSDDCQDKEC